MTTNVIQHDGHTCLHITKELTIYTAAAIKAVMQAAMTSSDPVKFDLGGVTEIDTAGLQLLLAANRTATGLGRPLSFTACSEAVSECLALSGLAPTLLAGEAR